MESKKQLWRNRKRKVDDTVKKEEANKDFTQTSKAIPSDYELESAWKNLKYFGERYNISEKTDDENNEVQYLISNWLEKRHVWKSAWKNVDNNHQCDVTCIENSIECISEEFNLWGCLVSGKTHQCFKDDRCKSTLTSVDQETVCIFSRSIVGKITQFTPFEKTESSRGDINYDSGIENNFDADADVTNEEIREFEQQLSMYDDFYTENPLLENTNETNTKQSTDSVKIKKKRGPKNGSKRSKQRKCFDLTNINDLISQAKTVIDDLIYNANTRKKINAKTDEKCTDDAIRSAIGYYKKSKNQEVIPCLLKIDSIFESELNKKRLYKCPQYNEDKVNHYVNIIVKLWRVIVNSPYCKGIDDPNKKNRKRVRRDANASQFQPREHAVACLYMMKRNYKIHVNGKVLLLWDKDEFLENNLFDESDLKEVPISNTIFTDKTRNDKIKTYSKNDITNGRNNIKTSILSIPLNEIESILRTEKLII